MWKLFLILLLSGSSLFVNGQVLHPINDAGAVTFKVVNRTIITTTVDGSFGELSGSIIFDPQHLEHASIQAAVKTNTIQTGIRARDNHLKKEEYFHVAQYPEIRIQSTSVSATQKANTFLFKGVLKMKGVTTQITFPFTAVRKPYGWLFTGTLSVNRRAFGVGPDNAIDDKVQVMLNVKAK